MGGSYGKDTITCYRSIVFRFDPGNSSSSIYPDSIFGIFRNNVIAFAVLIGIILLNHVSSKSLHSSSSIGESYFIRGRVVTMYDIKYH